MYIVQAECKTIDKEILTRAEQAYDNLFSPVVQQGKGGKGRGRKFRPAKFAQSKTSWPKGKGSNRGEYGYKPKGR